MHRGKTLFGLFLDMLKIGAFTFGGGYAMIALLQDEFVTRKKWLEEEEFLDLVAIAESTPGPIAINASTWIGYRRAGLPGAICATAGMCLPSFVIIFIISLFFDRFLQWPLVANAFRGIQACVVYLIFHAGIKMLRGIKKTPLSVAILAVTVAGLVACSLWAVNFSSVYYILISGGIGLAAYFLRRMKKSAKPADTADADREEDAP